MKNYEICVASRYMYSEYREYNLYTCKAQNMENATRYAKRVISYWNKKDNTTTYELFNIEEVVEHE